MSEVFSARRGEPFEGVWPEVHPAAFVHRTAVLIGQVVLGEGASVWANTTLRADEGRIVIGAGTNIQDGTTIHMFGGVSETIIGARVTVGHNVLLHGCQIADECLIGMGALLMDNVRVGKGSLIGAGSLLTSNRSIPPGSLAYGNPARLIGPVQARHRLAIEGGWRAYLESTRRYLAAAGHPGQP